MRDELRSLLISDGAAIVGIANLEEVPPDVRDAFPIGISIAVELDPRTISGIMEGPTRQYYNEYKRANDLPERLGIVLSNSLMKVEECASRCHECWH